MGLPLGVDVHFEPLRVGDLVSMVTPVGQGLGEGRHLAQQNRLLAPLLRDPPVDQIYLGLD